MAARNKAEFPLAWTAGGKRVALTDIAAYWRVKRRRKNGGGGSQVVLDPDDEESGPLLLPIHATKADLEEKCGPGSYYLEALDSFCLDVPNTPQCAVTIAGVERPESAEATEAAPPAPLVAPARQLELREEPARESPELAAMGKLYESAIKAVAEAHKEAAQLQRDIVEMALGSRLPSRTAAAAATTAPTLADTTSKLLAEVEALKGQLKDTPAATQWAPAINTVVTSISQLGTLLMASKMPGGLDAITSLMRGGLPSSAVPPPSAAGAPAGEGVTEDAVRIDMDRMAEFVSTLANKQMSAAELLELFKQFKTSNGVAQA